MSQENETTQSPPSAPQIEGEPLTSKGPDPEHLEVELKPEAKPEVDSPPSPRRKQRDVKKTALWVLLFLVAGLGIAVYFLIKERTRAFHDIENKLALLESRVRTLKDNQDVALAQSDRALEALKKDLQKFKEQAGEHFAAEERVLRELKSTRSSSSTAQEIASPGVVSMEQSPQPATEPFRPQALNGAGAINPPAEPGRSKEAQSFIDFVETVLKKTIGLTGELFQKTWDFLSDILKKPV